MRVSQKTLRVSQKTLRVSQKTESITEDSFARKREAENPFHVMIVNGKEGIDGNCDSSLALFDQ